jgi:imidazolonepropionase-like amidohydrolase
MITIHNCRIIPIDRPPIDRGAILIKGTKIHSVLDLEGGDVPEKADPVIDATGLTALPGMGQMHGHFSSYLHTMDTAPVNAQPDTLKAIQAVAFARNALLAGITMWREVGAHADIDLQLKRAVETGVVIGPRMLVAGRWIGAPGGHGSTLNTLQISGPERLRETVRQQVARGADGIKLIASGGVMDASEDPFRMEFTEDELQAGIGEANRAGKWVAVHSHPATSTRAAIKAGARSIEHATELPDDVIKLLLRHDVFIVPTFAAYYKLSHEGLDIGLDRGLVDLAYRVWDRKIQYFQRAVSAGVKFATGTDTGAPRVFHYELALELELMVRVGLSPEAALRSATASCAELMGWADRLGTLTAGKEADIVLIEGDPLKQISVVRNVRHVFKAGVPHLSEPPAPPLP